MGFLCQTEHTPLKHQYFFLVTNFNTEMSGSNPDLDQSVFLLFLAFIHTLNIATKYVPGYTPSV